MSWITILGEANPRGRRGSLRAHPLDVCEHWAWEYLPPGHRSVDLFHASVRPTPSLKATSAPSLTLPAGKKEKSCRPLFLVSHFPQLIPLSWIHLKRVLCSHSRSTVSGLLHKSLQILPLT